MSRAQQVINLFGSVGKTIGNSIWVHKNYDSVLPQKELSKAKEKIGNFKYVIIKHNRDTGDFSFISSKDFDTNPEPTVGEIKLVRSTGDVRDIPPSEDPKIYHRKELMVGSDYTGFDVSKAKIRSANIDRLGVDKSRIGSLSYWKENVLPKLKN